MRRGSRNYKLPVWILISLVAVVALSLVAYSCSRRESGRDESPAGPSAPYRLSVSAKPTELYPGENSLIMIDVKDGFGEKLESPVTVCVTTTGGVFPNSDNRFCGNVVDSASTWLRYETSDTPGPKTVTAIIDYGCENSYVSDTVEILFLPQSGRVASVSIRSDTSFISDADYGFATITATVMGEHGAPVAGVSVSFSVQGGTNASFDAPVVDTNALGVAQTVFRPNGDIGLLKVCATAGTKMDCTEIKSEKKTE